MVCVEMISIIMCSRRWKGEKTRGRKEAGYALLPESEASHFDEVLSDLGNALFTLVNHEVRPVYELLVNLPRVDGRV